MAWLPQTDPGVRILKVSGPFTLNAVFEFQSIVRQPLPALTIVDLSDVPYMDSAALGSVWGMHISCQRKQRAYALVGASERVKELFRMTGLNAALVLADSVDSARTASA